MSKFRTHACLFIYARHSGVRTRLDFPLVSVFNLFIDNTVRYFMTQIPLNLILKRCKITVTVFERDLGH